MNGLRCLSQFKTTTDSQIIRKAKPVSLLLVPVCVLLLFLAVFPAYADDPTFTTQRNFGPSSGQTQGIAVGDMDGDGDLDIVVGNFSWNVVYLNDGMGNFPVGRNFGVGWDLTLSVAVGDMDSDGDLDIVVGNSGQRNAVYLNDGTGNFPAAHDFGTGSEHTNSIAVGDMDGDGDMDIVTGNEWTPDEPNVVYLNDGGGNFPIGQNFGTGSDKTRGVAVGDMDNDGDLDIIVGNELGQQNVVYLNDGTGNFPVERDFGTGVDYTYSVAVGDVDGDEDLDIVTGNIGNQNVVYLNDGAGSFPLAHNFGTGSGKTTSVIVGDVDSDGDLDVVVGNIDNQNVAYLNDGGGNFPVGREFGTGRDYTESVAVGDVNSDGHFDLAVGNWGEQSVVYLNNGAGYFPVERHFGTGLDDTRSVAVGDMDGDSDLDIVAGNWEEQNVVYLNDETGYFPFGRYFGTGLDDTRSVAVGDMDSDGDLDIVVGNWSEQNVVYLNDGVGSFSAGCSFGADSDYTVSVATGDVDSDGSLDIIVGNWSEQNLIYLNDGTGSFHTKRQLGVKLELIESVIAVGDMEGDGDLDIVVGNSARQNVVYLNNGAGNLSAERNFGTGDDHTGSVALGDMDGDGDLDIVTGNTDGQNVVYLRDETGNFSIGRSFGTGGDYTKSVAVGDTDGDGDLDIVVGDGVRHNVVYLNDGGGNFLARRDFGTGDDHTESVALGDMDGDSDLDIVAGNGKMSAEQNIVYLNGLVESDRLADSPPYIAVMHPANVTDTLSCSTPCVLSGPTIPITYILFDPDGDSARRIKAFYSLNGGGQWFPATPATDTITTSLTASPWPTGTTHTFNWEAQADIIKSDNTVFRIEVYQGLTGPGPYQRPYLAAQTFPFRIQAADWYVKVATEDGDAVAGATIYYDGQPVTCTVSGLSLTNQAGLLGPGPLQLGKPLVTLSPLLYEQPTARDEHDGWAYRVHLTSLDLDGTGVPHPHIIVQPGEQLLTLRQGNPLVLFNVVASIEWDATVTYTNQISRALKLASDYLYDLTDGQMAFGHVSIYDNGRYWADADIQISTRNTVRPHAYVGGITSDDKSHVIRVGRHWDGSSGDQGPWDEPDGYRTLAHEFGHYALYLYDEYFAYTFDQYGNLTGEVPAYCTSPENRNSATDATNASAMDYHYTSSELSARDVTGMWFPLCEATAQWQLNGDSTWETFTRMYADTINPSRWQFSIPADRGSVMAGPVGFPSVLPNLPVVEVYQEGASGSPRRLTVYHPSGGGCWGAIVALYKQDGRVIGQGFTDSNGQLDIYGAIEGDTLRATSFDGGLAGSVTVGTEDAISLSLSPVGGLDAKASSSSIPHIRVRAEPGLDPGQIDLLVSLAGFGPSADPVLVVTEPGSEVGHAPTLSYSPGTGTYEGVISFSAAERGMGHVRAVGEVGGALVRLQSTYSLQQVGDEQSQDIYSTDGNLSLHLDAGSLPGSDAYFVIVPPGAVPGPVPEGMVLIGDPYDVTASGALVTLEKPAILKLHYDQALVNTESAPEGLGLYRWDPVSETWQAVTGTLDEEQEAIVSPVTTVGTYALLAPPGPWMNALQEHAFLPLVLKDFGP